jgi:hypothetical protein
VLVEPTEGEVINTQQPQFVWHYDTDICTPHHFEVLISELPDLSYSLWHSQTTGKTAWIPSYDHNFKDCTKYYWNVTAFHWNFTTRAHSETGTFYTNFTGFCPVYLEKFAIRDFLFYCADDPVSFMADFRFAGAIEGKFEARVLGERYPCIQSQTDPSRLVCYGKRLAENRSATIELWNLDTNYLAQTIESKTPSCVSTAEKPPETPQCQPQLCKGFSIPQKWCQSLCTCILASQTCP